MTPENGSWTEWSKHVLLELERLNKCYENLDEKLNEIHIEMSMLKVKSGVWGVIGGVVPVAIMVVIYLLTK